MHTILSNLALLLFIAFTSCKISIIPLMLFFASFSCNYTWDVKKRRVLIGSRMKGHQRRCDRQLTQKIDTMNLATARTS